MRLYTIAGLLAAAVVANASYINYTTVTGYFLQDDPSTDSSTFVYYKENFGLINRTYPGERRGGALGHGHKPTQWQRFYHELIRLNRQSPENVQYKVFFFGRHGEGYHNAAESYFGTPAWNCYWAELDGNNTNSWRDAALTANGVAQAQIAHDFWQELIDNQKIHTPDVYYVSPLTRCLQTANVTFDGLKLPSSGSDFKPIVKELLRENISIHTCDNRRNKTYIHNLFPGWTIEPGFTEDDEYWNGITGEPDDAEAVRSKKVLDEIFAELKSSEDDYSGCERVLENLFISVTSHSGEIGSILKVLGHRDFGLSTGAVIPVLIRAEFENKNVATTCHTWTTSQHCTAPPATSLSACVCASSAPAVTTPLVTITSEPPTVTGTVCY